MDTIRSYRYQTYSGLQRAPIYGADRIVRDVIVDATGLMVYQKEEREGAIRDSQSFVIVEGISGSLFCEEECRAINKQDLISILSEPDSRKNHAAGRRN